MYEDMNWEEVAIVVTPSLIAPFEAYCSKCNIVGGMKLVWVDRDEFKMKHECPHCGNSVISDLDDIYAEENEDDGWWD